MLFLFLVITVTVIFASEALAQPSTVVVVGNATNFTQIQSVGANTVPHENLTCVLTSKNPAFHHVPWAYALAGLIILAITFAAAKIIRIARQWLVAQGQLVLEANCNKGNYKGGFWDLIREGDYFPSLARFQFILWTFTVSFTLLSMYLLMMWNNTLCWSAVPQNILALMGISAGVPIVSMVISREKYTKSIAGSLPCKENVPALSTMLLEHSKPTIGRYQMFLWTFISIIIYLGLFLQQINGISNMEGLTQLKLPDIDPSLLFLMGLSQAGYLGAKAVARPVAPLTIVGKYPEQNQKNVKRSIDIVVSFSESLDSTTVNNVSFGVKKHTDGINVPGNSSVLAQDDKMAVFNPTAELDANTEYDVYILKTIQSKDKKGLESDETWSFQTGA